MNSRNGYRDDCQSMGNHEWNFESSNVCALAGHRWRSPAAREVSLSNSTTERFRIWERNLFRCRFARWFCFSLNFNCFYFRLAKITLTMDTVTDFSCRDGIHSKKFRCCRNQAQIKLRIVHRHDHQLSNLRISSVVCSFNLLLFVKTFCRGRRLSRRPNIKTVDKWKMHTLNPSLKLASLEQIVIVVDAKTKRNKCKMHKIRFQTFKMKTFSCWWKKKNKRETNRIVDRKCFVWQRIV